MSTLRALQQRLATEILGHAAAAPPPDDGFAEQLRLPAGVDADSRLAIYRDGYPARILDALRDVYPAIANICGDGSFANLSRRYLRATDLSGTALNQVGAELPGYIRADPLAAALPFLPDLAHLEWLVLRAFHSRDRSPVDPASFAAFDMDDWERVVFAFQPSVAVVQSRWPIRDLWLSRDTPRDQIDIDLTERPQTGLVHRDGYDVGCRLLDASESAVLGALLDGARLGDAVEAAAALPDAASDFSAMFAAWFETGLVVSVELPK